LREAIPLREERALGTMPAVRRLARYLFTLCSVVSLLLCVAVCVLWVRSCWVTDQLIWQRVDGRRSGQSAQGGVVLDLSFSRFSGRPADFCGLIYASGEARPALWYEVTLFLQSRHPGDTTAGSQWGGFGWYETRKANGDRYASVVAPFWSFALASAVLPLGWTTMRLCSRIHARRRKGGALCLNCGYDLRASPERCPECGTATAKAVSA
jgi:hypothetical protein